MFGTHHLSWLGAHRPACPILYCWGCLPCCCFGCCRATPAFLDLFSQAAAEVSQLEPSSGSGSSADVAEGGAEVAPGGDSFSGRVMGGSSGGSSGGPPAGAAAQYEQRMWSKCLMWVGVQPAASSHCACGVRPTALPLLV